MLPTNSPFSDRFRKIRFPDSLLPSMTHHATPRRASGHATTLRFWTWPPARPGPPVSLPLTDEMLLNSPSGDLFGMTQSAGMGWDPKQLLRDQVLILSTQGGLRAENGKPIALGYHTGHWEVGLLVKAAAEELNRLERLPFAAAVSDPCDGRSQGTTAMMDSLPYRNDAAVVLKRLIRSLPLRRGVIGVATCDKGLPAMMMALAAQHDLPTVIVPGGVTLPAARRRGCRKGAVDRRPLRRGGHHARIRGRHGLPCLRLGRRRLPVPRDGGHVAGRGRGVGTGPAAHGTGSFRTADLAGRRAAGGPRRRGARPREESRRATSSPTMRSKMR